jgi:hypothetical protein
MPIRTTTTAWTRAGMFALPLYGILLFVGTLTPQPDQTTDPEGWARFVSSTSYLIAHVVTGVVGAALVILGTFALAVLTASRSPRLSLTGMLLSVVGQVLFTVPAVISTFATPAIGQAYLRGNRDVMTLEFSGVMTVITLLAVLLTVTGNVILGIAVTRSRLFPRWTGITWAAGAVIFYLLGAALGMATTGASLPTQPVGAALMAIASAAMAWTAARSREPLPATPSGSAATTSP